MSVREPGRLDAWTPGRTKFWPRKKKEKGKTMKLPGLIPGRSGRPTVNRRVSILVSRGISILVNR
jgi:hypothetical protein